MQKLIINSLKLIIFVTVDNLQKEKCIVEKIPPNWVYFCCSSQHSGLQLSNCTVWRLFCLGVLGFFATKDFLTGNNKYWMFYIGKSRLAV